MKHSDVATIRRRLKRAWSPFFTRFGRLTVVQLEAIPKILDGLDVVIASPTASGKTEAAKTLVRHLGGVDNVVFLTDRVLFASQAINHILELDDSKVVVSTEDDGRRRLDGALATVWLGPGEDLRTVDASTLHFEVHDERVLYEWRNRAKVELGHRVREESKGPKPIVIEAAFGSNVEPENPFGRTIHDFFARLEKAGVEPRQVGWIIVEAGYDTRSERNERRRDNVPVHYFERFGADGGDLAPDHQKRLEEQGTMIRRVPNDHGVIERFRADVIAAFGEMFGDVLSARVVDDN